MGFEVGGDFGGELVAEVGQLLGAYACDVGEGFGGGGVVAGHLAEGDIAEDDVGGDASGIGKFSA